MENDIASMKLEPAQGESALPGSARPRIWPCLTAFALALPAAIAVQIAIVILIVLVLLTQSGGARENLTSDLLDIVQSPSVFLIFLITSQLVFACASLIPARMSPEPIRQRLGLVPATIHTGGTVATMVGSLFVWQLGGLLWELLFDEVSANLQSMTDVFVEAPLPMAVLLIVCASVLPGVCEELLCRGYLQRRLLQRWPPLLAVGFSSLGFAAMHVDPQHVIAVIPLGLWLGYVAWRSRSTWPGIFCHMFVNATAFTMIVAVGPELAEQTSWGLTGIIIGLSLPFFIAAVIQLERGARR